MARNTQNTRGGNRSGSRSSRSNTNNPEGRNQYNSGFMGMARERPVAAAAAAAGAVAAGVFLWSKRSQISDQLSHISDQIGEWSENRELETVGGDTSFSSSRGTGSTGEFIDSTGTTGSTARSGRTTSGSTTGRRGTGTSSSGAGTSGRTRP